MKIYQTDIEGVLILEPDLFGDARGYFFESFSRQRFEEAAGAVDFVQDNESKSRYGVVRGLHFQRGEAAQAKLVRVVSGTVLDVAVDIPRGFAHGFAVLSDEAVFQYKCDNYYAPASEDGIAWDDPALGIDWRLPADAVVLSEKDRRRPTLAEAGKLFEYRKP